MKRLSKFTQTALGRATMGFVGTAFVLLVTPLFAFDPAVDTQTAVQLSDSTVSGRDVSARL